VCITENSTKDGKEQDEMGRTLEEARLIRQATKDAFAQAKGNPWEAKLLLIEMCRENDVLLKAITGKSLLEWCQEAVDNSFAEKKG
jgi:hypothetical protein